VTSLDRRIEEADRPGRIVVCGRPGGGEEGAVELTFSGEVWFWRGPAPWYFVTVPDDGCRRIQQVAGEVSYGWGMIPAVVTLGSTTWPTALWPKDGRYLVPLRTQVRQREEIDEGDTVTVRLAVGT
jgi:hypothetical protein